MLITLLQLSQMVIGVAINVYALWVKSRGEECLVQSHHIHLALVMYASYFLLFMNFFVAAYLKSQQVKRENNKQANATNNNSKIKAN
jgi:elongation of very long chain fatty acids protein 6